MLFLFPLCLLTIILFHAYNKFLTNMSLKCAYFCVCSFIFQVIVINIWVCVGLTQDKQKNIRITYFFIFSLIFSVFHFHQLPFLWTVKVYSVYFLNRCQQSLYGISLLNGITHSERHILKCKTFQMCFAVQLSTLS